MENFETILKQMSLDEKAAFTMGASFWKTKRFKKYGIPSVTMSDGPHGLRKQEKSTDMLGLTRSVPSTCFPSEVTTGCSFDPELLERIGRAIALEAKERSVEIVLGPGVNIKRNPLCGRNFEYFSEDPYLSGVLGSAFIRGVERENVGTSVKHFAANSQETKRFQSDSVMDERTLREIYLPAFERAVKEGKPATVMCSYNKLNGVHLSENRRLLTEILRGEWGYEGAVITDWGAMNDRVKAIGAGCDLNMPGDSKYMKKEVREALKNGKLSEEDLDRAVLRLLKLAFRYRKAEFTPDADISSLAYETAKSAAISGAVLLKNDDAILPIRENASIAILGAMAREMRYQGAGSSHIRPQRLTHPKDHKPDSAYAEGYKKNGSTTDALLREAAETAASCDVAVVFAGLPDHYESEGFDRSDMKMPEGMLRLIDETVKANENTVVVLMAGAPVECPFADSVKAILYMGLPGEAGGEAVWELLHGSVSPSGKLAESWPVEYGDVPSAPAYGKTTDAHYDEGIFVGYRYYDKENRPVRFPFGFGLSYTTFSYEKMEIDGRTVRVTVRNTGERSGHEVVELYVGSSDSDRPVRELKAFQKIEIPPGECRTAEFSLSDRDFAVWDDGWHVRGGEYTVSAGGSSRDLPLASAIDLPEIRITKNASPEDGEAEKETLPSEKGRYTMENSIEDMQDDSKFMRFLYRLLSFVLGQATHVKKNPDNPEYRMMMNSSVRCPLRTLEIVAGLRHGFLAGALDIANGHGFRGVRKMIFGR